MSHGNWQKYHSQNPIQSFLLERFLQKAELLTQSLSLSSVLDIGCAEGFVLSRIQKQGMRCVGIDCDGSALSRGKGLHPSLEFYEGYAEKLPFEDNAFDMVVCMEVLEHVKDPVLVLQEIRRVSAKWVLLSVPHEPWFCMANFLRGKNFLRFGNDPEHVNHWTGRRFSHLLQGNGLRVQKATSSFPWLLRLAIVEGH